METISNFIGGLIATPFICLGWIIVGVVAGGLARALVGARNASACSDLVLGIIGAFVGAFLAGLLGIYRPEGGLSAVIVSLLVATVGAVVVLLIWRMITGGRRV